MSGGAVSEPLRSYEMIWERIRPRLAAAGPRVMALVGANDRTALQTAAAMARRGVITPVLIGEERRVRGVAAASGVDISGFRLIHAADAHEACFAAARLAIDGEADILFRARVPAYLFLRILCRRETGFRTTDQLLTHVAVFELRSQNRLVFVSDGGVVVAPDTETKIRILRQAVAVARRFGIERPRVALLAAVETVAPYLPVAMEEAAIAKMGDRGQLGDAVVDGPLSLDIAISPQSAAIKGIDSPVAGVADVLIVPQIEAGNAVYKTVVSFTDAQAGGVVVGARVPLVLLGESDRKANHLNSILLAAWLSLEQGGAQRSAEP
jgi:phosphate butyryltransferase